MSSAFVPEKLLSPEKEKKSDIRDYLKVS